MQLQKQNTIINAYIIDTMYVFYYNRAKEVKDMFVISATEARKEWSSVIDNAIRQRPQFIKRTRDQLVLSNINFIKEILRPYKFMAYKQIENDGSITISLEKIELTENASTEGEAKKRLAKSIKEYFEDFYKNFEYWGSASGKAEHMPFALKAILCDSIDEIIASIECSVRED